jgi:hypothetical protein
MVAPANHVNHVTLKHQGIMEHAWYTKELPPFLQDALDDMDKEQV